MKKILTLLAFFVNFSFCFGQDEIKDSTFLTTIELDRCCGERTYATCENQRERFQDSGCQYCAIENGYGNENVVAYTGSAFG